MDKLSSILVIADGRPSDGPVLKRAVDLARAFGAVIDLYTCDWQHAGDLRRAYDTAGIEKEWLERVWESRGYLESLRASASCPDVQIFVDATCDNRLQEAYLKKIESCRPDLVMKSASHGHPGRFALDNGDWELMRTCPVTLMLVREAEWTGKPSFAAMLDMLVEQPRDVAMRVLHAAEYLAAGCGAQLEVVYCERDPSSPDRSERAEALQRLAHEHQVGSDHVHVLSGDPDETLPAFAANRSYDMVVLGSLTHHKSLASLVGRLTGRLGEALECDVLLVKEPPAAAPLHGNQSEVLWQGVFGD